MVSLGKLFLVLARVAKPLASGVSAFDSGEPGDVGSATEGRRSLEFRFLCKSGKDPWGAASLCWDPAAGATVYGV